MFFWLVKSFSYEVSLKSMTKQHFYEEEEEEKEEGRWTRRRRRRRIRWRKSIIDGIIKDGCTALGLMARHCWVGALLASSFGRKQDTLPWRNSVWRGAGIGSGIVGSSNSIYQYDNHLSITTSLLHQDDRWHFDCECRKMVYLTIRVVPFRLTFSFWSNCTVSFISSDYKLMI